MRTQTLRTKTVGRKERFRAATALARTTIGQWATDNGVTRSHLYAVLAGDRDSQSLTEKVDSFIAKYLPDAAA